MREKRDTFAGYRERVERDEAEPPRRGPGSELARFLRTAKVTPEIEEIVRDVEESRQGLAKHLGGEGNLTPVQVELLKAWARNEILEKLAFREVCKAGLSTKTAKICSAGMAFSKYQRNCRELMKMLGLLGDRKPNNPSAPSSDPLQAYLKNFQREKEPVEEEEE